VRLLSILVIRLTPSPTTQKHLALPLHRRSPSPLKRWKLPLQLPLPPHLLPRWWKLPLHPQRPPSPSLTSHQCHRAWWWTPRSPSQAARSALWTARPRRARASARWRRCLRQRLRRLLSKLTAGAWPEVQNEWGSVALLLSSSVVYLSYISLSNAEGPRGGGPGIRSSQLHGCCPYLCGRHARFLQPHRTSLLLAWLGADLICTQPGYLSLAPYTTPSSFCARTPTRVVDPHMHLLSGLSSRSSLFVGCCLGLFGAARPLSPWPVAHADPLTNLSSVHGRRGVLNRAFDFISHVS